MAICCIGLGPIPTPKRSGAILIWLPWALGRTGRVGKRHVSDLRNDFAVQLDVFAEMFRAASQATPMRQTKVV